MKLSNILQGWSEKVMFLCSEPLVYFRKTNFQPIDVMKNAKLLPRAFPNKNKA